MTTVELISDSEGELLIFALALVTGWIIGEVENYRRGK